MREYDDKTLKQVQKLELMILSDFLDICEKYNLKYFGIGGTAIGALRHGGFIPWDDDIDLALPREDFDILIEHIKKDYNDKYLVMNAMENKNYPLMTTRIMLKGTKFRESVMRNIDCDFGIFLDIYPYDKISDNEKERKKQLRDAWFYSKLLILRSIPFPVLGFGGVKAKLVHMICAIIYFVMKVLHISKSWIARKCTEASTRYNHYEKTKCINFMCNTTPYKNVFETDDVYPLARIKFEEFELCFPNNMHENLKREYGDYMSLPPIEKRKNHFPYELDFGKYID